MNKFSLNFTNVKHFSQMQHAHKPRIQFLGKRSLIHPDKHILHTSEGDKQSEAKSTSENYDVSSAINMVLRPKMSQEEIDIINNGGPIAYKDWNKIKVKAKKASI